MLSDSNARLAAARRLTRRQVRRETGLFLAEGAPAVREALAREGTVQQLFATAAAAARNPQLCAGADEISEKAAAGLSETVTPQGVVAVCRLSQPTLPELLAPAPRLLAVLVEPNDPGNVGTIIRTADAAGADAVVVAGGVDPYNGKAVRATAGSLFHLPVVEVPPDGGGLLAQLHDAGLTTLATTGAGSVDLDELGEAGGLAAPTAWLFGTEAHGLPAPLLEAARHRVRVPIYGRAESLNLASAAAVCLYASARAQRR